MSPTVRRILHVDMDAFYASVEQRDDPQLRGRPVAVGGSPGGRGVVAAASYEARAFGVRSAMPSGRAARLCPDLVFVRPDFAKYKMVSRTVFSLFREVTPHVEGLSLDEAYLDVTDHLAPHGTARAVAVALRSRIQREVGLTASAGVSHLKFVAKIASGYRKPDGLTVVPPERLREFLDPLPVTSLWGVGPRTAERLHAAGLRTIAQVAQEDRAAMIATFGRHGGQIWDLAQGFDPRPVRSSRPRKSRSAERTFSEDILEISVLDAHIQTLAERVVRGLPEGGSTARTVVLKVRLADFVTLTRSERRPDPVTTAGHLASVATRLLRKTPAGEVPVRLLGVGLAGFAAPDAPRQLQLPFDDTRGLAQP